jgi:hypothetical protein
MRLWGGLIFRNRLSFGLPPCGRAALQGAARLTLPNPPRNARTTSDVKTAQRETRTRQLVLLHVAHVCVCHSDAFMRL